MKHGPGRLAAAVAALLVLTVPMDLSAARWRGANVILALLNGRNLRGELVAVKTDALVLSGLDASVESVPVGEIKTIRLVRRSKIWQRLLGGFVAGAVGGAVWGGLNAEDSDLGTAWAAFFGGLIVAVPASVVGLAAGLGAGLDDEIELAGLSEAERPKILGRLSREARQPEAYIAPANIAMAGGSNVRSFASRYERKRFGLTWTPGYRVGGHSDPYGEDTASFRFLEDIPPGEAGPLISDSYSFGDRARFSLRRMGLSYAFSRRFAAEAELDVPDRLEVYRSMDMMFTSSVDGTEYHTYAAAYENIRAVSLLLGLSFRPRLPEFLRPHSLELAVAAGPAWIYSTRQTDSYDPGFCGSEVWRTRVWTARVRASYEYRFAPSFSMGFSAEYRRLQAEIPTSIWTGTLTFFESSYSAGRTITRTTEVTFPGRTAALGGFGIGLTFGAHF